MQICTTLRSLLFGVLLGVLFTAATAHAQTLRPDGAFYLKPRLGANAYDGDRAGAFRPGPSTGIEVGYAERLGPLNGSLGAYFLAGRYPEIRDAVLGAQSVGPGELEMWRHTLGLSGQIGFLPEQRLSPYVQLGAGTTLGVVDNALKAAFSPFGGVGLDYALNDQVGFFTEFTGILSLPDGRLDAASGLDGQQADWFSFFGGGVRIGLNRAFTPVRVLSVDGPTRLSPGEQATYTATVNAEEASGSVEYEWRLGGAVLSRNEMLDYRFDEPGNYTLELVSRNEGSTDERVLNVAVSEPDPPATASADEADAPQTVRYDNGEAERAAGDKAEATPPATADASEPDQATDMAVSCADIVDFNATYFEEGTARLTEDGQRALRENAQVLEQCPTTEVRLEAYALTGADAAAALAQRRARAVEQFYREQGIAAQRIRVADVLTADPGTIKQSEGLQALRRVDTVPTVPMLRQVPTLPAATAGRQ